MHFYITWHVAENDINLIFQCILHQWNITHTVFMVIHKGHAGQRHEVIATEILDVTVYGTSTGCVHASINRSALSLLQQWLSDNVNRMYIIKICIQWLFIKQLQWVTTNLHKKKDTLRWGVLSICASWHPVSHEVDILTSWVGNYKICQQSQAKGGTTFLS